MLAEDRRFVGVMFEFEEILGGILQKERVVLDARPGEPHPRLLIERKPVRFRSLDQFLPLDYREKYQAEVAWVDSLLRRKRFLDQMRDKLMTGQPERHSPTRFTPQRTTEPVDIESLGRSHIMRREGQVEDRPVHTNRPLTVGRPDPFHQPAAMFGVTW